MAMIPIGFLAVAFALAAIDQYKCEKEHEQIVRQLQREAMLEYSNEDLNNFRMVLDREKLFREYCSKQFED